MHVSGSSRQSRQGLLASADGQAKAPRADQIKREETPRKFSLAASALRALIQGYRLVISPWIGPRCRFLPTCSDYALDALARHGAIRGGWLIVRRLARCHPLGGSGFDPVPDTVERDGSQRIRHQDLMGLRGRH